MIKSTRALLLAGASALAILASAAEANAETFTVPGMFSFTASVPGEYAVELLGASGGNATFTGGNVGGLGAEVSGDVFLTAGEDLTLYVGGQGETQQAGGGGGGSFVFRGMDVLAVAGGGGGGGRAAPGGGGPGLAGTSGGTGGGTGGTGGAGGTGGGGGGGGAGVNTGPAGYGGNGPNPGIVGGFGGKFPNGGGGAAGLFGVGGVGGFGGGGGGGGLVRASCFLVYAYPAFLMYAGHSLGLYWVRISPQASETVS